MVSIVEKLTDRFDEMLLENLKSTESPQNELTARGGKSLSVNGGHNSRYTTLCKRRKFIALTDHNAMPIAVL